MNNLGRRRRVLVIVFFVMLFSIITLSIAYAVLSTSLNITGSADVVASTWDVHLANPEFISFIPSFSKPEPLEFSNDYNSYKVVPLAGHDACIENCISSINNTTLSFKSSAIENPGDFKAISFDVVNDGSIDAKLDGFTLSGISSDQDVYLNYYILYSDGTTPKSGDVLSAGSFDSMVLVIEFDKNVTAEQLPTANQNLDLSLTLNYVQN